MKNESDILKKRHWDWPWPFKYIPRSWTAFNWGNPKLVAGTAEMSYYTLTGWTPKPINPPGTWQISRYPDLKWFGWLPLYFGFTLKSGRHFRIGARWDDVDNYTQFPSIATRKYTFDPGEDTSCGKPEDRK